MTRQILGYRIIKKYIFIYVNFDSNSKWHYYYHSQMHSCISARPNQINSSFITSRTIERTAIKIEKTQLLRSLMLMVPQPCLSPVSDHFSVQMCVFRPSSAAVRFDQGRGQGLCVHRNSRHRPAYSRIGWQTCQSFTLTTELSKFSKRKGYIFCVIIF